MIHLVLTDDWELRGDGSGNPTVIQFAAMRSLRSVYEAHGLRASFNVEVLQQLAHLDQAGAHPELAAVAMEWEDAVRETFRRGHDVQVHVHPQWSDAVYDGGRWELRGAWSILDYPAAEARSMIARAKRYLEDLLTPLDPDYRCVSWRSGSWCIAPSDHMLRTLSELGIVFDTSIADGLVRPGRTRFETPRVRLDYRGIDEPFLPYYPDMRDARRAANSAQPIVCLPTHTFRASTVGRGLRAVGRRVRRRTHFADAITRRWVAPADTPLQNAGYEARGYASRAWGAGSHGRLRRRSPKVSDLCGLSFVQMREMLRDIRRRARAAGVERVPVIIENHSKDLGDLGPLRLFAKEVAGADDVVVITLSEVAENIKSGAYAIRTAAA